VQLGADATRAHVGGGGGGRGAGWKQRLVSS
jgi:hypothetical protein